MVDFFDNKIDLVPVASNRFVLKKSVLGLIDVPLPEMSVRFTAAAGKRVAVLEGLPAPFAFERIEKKPIPPAWRARFGRYQCEGDATLAIRELDLRVEDGVLVAHTAVSSRVLGHDHAEGSLALDSISDGEAAVIGVGNNEGLVLRTARSGDKDLVWYSGYRCARMEEAGH